MARDKFNAEMIAEQIKRNVREVDSGAITWEQFTARQRQAWDSVSMGEPNIIGSACDKRHMAVHKHLNRE
jgi:hypothetical protein